MKMWIPIKVIFSVWFILIATHSDAIEFVSIEHAGNVANKYGYGRIDYIYYIGKYEITNQQYCDFLNCVAQKQIRIVFFTADATAFLGGLIREGKEGNYTYKCKSGYETDLSLGLPG